MIDPQVYIPASIGVVLIAAFVFHALYRARHPLIDLRLFKNRVVALANATMFLYAIAAFGIGLLLPSYLQQLMGQTPLQSGAHLIPLGLGAASTIPLAGRFMDRRGPGKVVLVGIALMATGMATFAFAVSRDYAYMPVVLIGLTPMGMGMGFLHSPAGAGWSNRYTRQAAASCPSCGIPGWRASRLAHRNLPPKAPPG